jgi:RNA polymerase sigma factor (sigma-70 family)
MTGISKIDIEQLLDEIKHPVFNLSVRMLSDIPLAEDATQDILLKIFSQINTLKESSKFKPWALTIAKNHLLNVIKADTRFQFISFEVMEKDCNLPMPEISPNSAIEPEKERMLAELKISCSMAMLMCLAKDERFVYILSSMFGLNSVDGSEIMETSPDNYRQKLHRAKSKLKNFLENNCGLISPNATCKCRKRLDYALQMNRISNERPMFSSGQFLESGISISAFIEMMEKYEDYSDIFKQNPHYVLPEETGLLLLEKINNHFLN